ncbi:metallophosphoesterase [Rhizobium sp. OAE497]|uniref:metallophosphoesterase family protein n=1 Tax=Rhizobium sp. OAE497 TaxID=2663796 RepID=UPI0018F27E20
MVSIIHFTDLHFGAGRNNRISFSDVLQHLVVFIKNLDLTPIIVVSGDVTFKAQDDGYTAAIDFFDELIEKANLDRSRFIVCPGNHDIQLSSPFARFSAFSYALRRDKVFDFNSNTSVSYEIDGIYFIVTNSSYHAKKEYGLVDLLDMRAAMKGISSKDYKQRFAVIHHHLLPLFEQDISVTRNSYEYLSILDSNNVSAILHGHQHFNVAFPVGKNRMSINGAGSFGYAENGVVNSLNVYHVEDERIELERFALLVDQPTVNTTGFSRIGERQLIR